MPKNKLTPIEDRFWTKVNKTAYCWEWTGSVSGSTYSHGEIGAGRRGQGQLKAHRVSWEIHNGAIPDGLQVLHKCDNGICVRPDHLFLGTQGDNMRDCAAKGRVVNQNTYKTVCIRNHELSGQNLKLMTDGSRRCRECMRIRDRLYKSRKVNT